MALIVLQVSLDLSNMFGFGLLLDCDITGSLVGEGFIDALTAAGGLLSYRVGQNHIYPKSENLWANIICVESSSGEIGNSETILFQQMIEKGDSIAPQVRHGPRRGCWRWLAYRVCLSACPPLRLPIPCVSSHLSLILSFYLSPS